MRTSSRRILVAMPLAAIVGVLAILTMMRAADATVAGAEPRATAGIDANTNPAGGPSPVYSIVEANGRWYIGGDFQTVAGENQPFLAAIEVATGRLDQLWRPQVNGVVNTIAVTPDGSAVFVGGKFNTIDNSYPSRIAKLDPITGAVDQSFDPDANAAVESIVTDGTTVWAAGAFATIGGVSQPYVAKLDATGLVDTAFDPVADGKILDLELHSGRLFLAGNFTSFDGVTHERIASLDPTTGVVDAWAPSSGFKVYDVSLHPDGTVLYAAGAGSLSAGGNSLTAWDTTTGGLLWRRVNSGDFQAVVATDELVYIGTHGEFVYIDNNGPFLEDDANPNAVRRNKLAAFDPLTGDLDDWNPGANSVWGVWSLSLGPSGLLVGGDFTTIGGQVQPHFAVFDGPTVGNHSPTPDFTSSCVGTTCTFDASISSDPDGSIVSYAWSFGDGQTATGVSASIDFDDDSMNTVSLTVVDDGGTSARTQNLIPVGDGQLDVEPVAVATQSSSASSISATLPLDLADGDFAVAFVATNDQTTVVTPPAGWTEGGTQTSGSMSSGVWYSPVDQADAGVGVSFGFAGTVKADLTIATFRYVDLTTPIAAIASEPESALWGEHSAPSITTVVPSTVLHYWADRSGDTFRVAGPGNEAVIARSSGTGGGHMNTELSLVPSSGAGSTAEAVAIGGVHTRSATGWSVALTELAVTPTCSATLNVDDTIDLDWTDVRRATSYVVRRNGSYVASVGTTVGYEDNPGAGTWDYLIRVQADGVTTDVPCTPAITIDDPPPFVQTCTATLNPDDSITLDWNQIPGENGYSVRRNGSYVSSANNVLTYTDTPGPGTWDYIIRSKKNGITTNTNCTPTITIDDPPPFVQTCTATLNPDDSITLDWDAIAGENSYQVRRNGAWLTSTSELTYTDPFAIAGDTYVIRSRISGVTTNTDCL